MGEPHETFECAVCHGTFRKLFTDAEVAIKRAEDLAAGTAITGGKVKLVCEECYRSQMRKQKIMMN